MWLFNLFKKKQPSHDHTGCQCPLKHKSYSPRGGAYDHPIGIGEKPTTPKPIPSFLTSKDKVNDDGSSGEQ